METSDLHPDHRELIELFVSIGVEFILVGSYALAVHGYVRYTEDLDLWVKRTAENAARIRAALKEFGITLNDSAEVKLTQDRQLLQIGIKPQMIDILTFLDGCEFETAFEKAQDIPIAGQTLKVLSLTDFIATKKASGRPKDLDDLRRLGENLGRRLV